MTYDSKQFGKVAVLVGGQSAEREISLQGGERVYQALLNKGVDVVAIDVNTDIIEQLQQAKPDRAFIALHGTFGEDGTMQAILEALRIPYTGSGVMASALTMDKQRSKWLWQGVGLPTKACRLLTEEFDQDKLITDLGLPLFIKPNSNGSSVGISKVTCKEELYPAFVAAREYDTHVLAEAFIDGAEYTIGILDGQALPVFEIRTPREFYDYEAKYLEDSTQYLCPCDLSESQQNELQELAVQAFASTGCHHLGRVDFMQDSQGKFWLLEVNSIPGFTEHSVVPMAAKQMGIEFDDFVLKVLAGSLR